MLAFDSQADLRRADLRAKRRAMEDTLMALEVKNIYVILQSKDCFMF